MTGGPIQRTVHFSGRVQGVGFRWAAADVARGFAVTGYVQNLEDRRVRLVAEGTAAEVRAFLDAVHERMRDHIQDASHDDAPAEGGYRDFTIKR